MKAKVDKSREKAIDVLGDLDNIQNDDTINQWYLDRAKEHLAECINCLGILGEKLKEKPPYWEW